MKKTKLWEGERMNNNGRNSSRKKRREEEEKYNSIIAHDIKWIRQQYNVLF